MLTHSQRLERWLGAAEVEQLSRNFRGWYGPPVAVSGVPGDVFVCGDGDFTGEYRGSAVISGLERAREIFRREERRRFQRALGYQRGSFASLSALVTAATAGKQVRMNFSKTGTAPTAIRGAIDLWGLGALPAAGAVGGAQPGGTDYTARVDPGALAFSNAVVNANSSHFVNAWVLANYVNTLLLCDRLASVLITPSSSGAQSVSATAKRYTSTTNTATNAICGSFIYPAAAAAGALGSVAHNWTVCKYCVDEASECITRRLGWTNINDLKKSDEILAFDPDTRTTRWEPLEGIFLDRHYRGDMVSIGEREFNAFTTPDHRWPVLQRYDHEIVVQRTESLTNVGWLLRHAEHEAPTSSPYSDEFVRLAAWYFTEGSLHGEHSIGIAQSTRVNNDYVEMIRADIKALGAQHKTCKQAGFLRLGRPRSSRCEGLWVSEYLASDGMAWFRLSGLGVDAFKQAIQGQDKVPSREFLLSLTAHQLKEFVRVCQLGDGTPERRLFYQHNAARMDAYMLAAVLAGGGPNLHADGTACSLREAHTGIGKLPRTTLYYEGVIWCPITRSGHWVMRRYGKTCITGNTDQDGNAGISAPSAAGINGCAANQIDLALGNWFMPLASGDCGVSVISQIQCDVATLTGSMNFVIAHPIAALPVPIVNIAMNIDGVASAFNLVPVLDGANLYFIELPKPATNATTYTGIVATVSE